MKKTLLSLFLCVTAAFSALAGCEKGKDSSSTDDAPQKIDYVSQLKLESLETTATHEVYEITLNHTGTKNYTHIDGDTTHFEVPFEVNEKGTLKVRYMGIDTPESTGDIEVWGKAASKFTKEKLLASTSILLESDGAKFTEDSNGRTLAWVWYKLKDATEYRLLNLELLQEGLAFESRTEDARYDEICNKATMQADSLNLYVHSNDKDPDFYYGAAIKTTLKEMRSNLNEYVGKRVAIDCTITTYAGKGSLYVEYYDEEDKRSYGIPVFYGYNNSSYDSFLTVGNNVRIVGELSNSENFGWQISGLFYDFINPDNPESLKVFSYNNSIIYPEVTVAEFIANDYAWAEMALYSSVSLQNLVVQSVYTTETGGDSDGSMTITCKQADCDTSIKIRTNKLYNAEGNLITQDYYEGKTISVKGIVETYMGNYQVNVFSANNITIVN